MTGFKLSTEQEELVERACANLWVIERAPLKRMLSNHLFHDSRFAKAIPSSGLNVVTYSLAGLMWLRRAVVFAACALVFSCLQTRSNGHNIFRTLELTFWIIGVIPFLLCLNRVAAAFRAKSSTTSH